MSKELKREQLSPDALARTIQDIQERAEGLQGDIQHLLAHFIVGDGSYAQLSCSCSNLSRAVSSMAMATRLAQEVE